jgi:hypothetical protein
MANELFDKDERPNFDGLTEDQAWAALEEFESYIYRVGSDGHYDLLWNSYHAAKAELYAKYE